MTDTIERFGDETGRMHVNVLSEPVMVLDTQIHTYSLLQVLNVIEHTLLTGKRAIIANVNIHAMNLAYELPWFRTFLNDCDVVFCDGFGVKVGAYLLGYRIPHRFTPPDWIAHLAELAAQREFTLYFLGAKPGVAEKAAGRLVERVPNLQIVGMQHGYFDKTVGSPENEAIIQAINVAHPHILLIGFGMPLQEQWLLENWQRLNVSVALPVGAMFDYVAGSIHRGPRWMTDHGLEWVARLWIEPGRLWRRYLIGNPLFLSRVLKQRVRLLRLPRHR